MTPGWSQAYGDRDANDHADAEYYRSRHAWISANNCTGLAHSRLNALGDLPIHLPGLLEDMSGMVPNIIDYVSRFFGQCVRRLFGPGRSVIHRAHCPIFDISHRFIPR